MRRSSINSVCGVLVFAFALGVFAGCSGGGGGDKIDSVVCTPPFVPSSSGTLCVCPPGTHDGNQTCVPNGTTDTTPPTVTLVSPTNGSNLSGMVNVVANVTDASGIVGVTLYLDDKSRNENFTEGPAGTYTAQLNTTALASGSHSVKVCALDSLVNPGCSASVSVTVNNTVPDTTPPTVTVTSPANGATASGTVALTASVTDDRGIAEVSLSVDGAQAGNTFIENPAHVFTTSVDTTTMTNGSHTLRVCATDTSTNTGCSITIGVTVSNLPADTTPPTVTITSPITGSTVSGWTKLSADASDSGSGVLRVRFRVLFGGSYYAGSDSYVYTAPYTNLYNLFVYQPYTTGARYFPNGPITIQAEAQDNAGNISSTSVNVTLDNGLFSAVKPVIQEITRCSWTNGSSYYCALVSWTDDTVGARDYVVYCTAPVHEPAGPMNLCGATYPYSDNGYEPENWRIGDRWYAKIPLGSLYGLTTVDFQVKSVHQTTTYPYQYGPLSDPFAYTLIW